MDYKELIKKLRTESLYRDKATLEIMDLCMEAATAITDLLIENQALRNAANDFKARAEAAVAENRRWTQICEAQVKQIDRLQTQVENTEKKLEALKKDYREFRTDAWNTMYEMLGAGGYVDRDIKGFFDRWRKR